MNAVEALVNESQDLESNGKLIAAAEPLRRAVNLAPDDPAILLALGTLDVRTRNVYMGQEAVRTLQRYTRLSPQDPAGERLLGDAQAQAGNADEAAQAYRRYLALRPGDGEAYLYLAGQELITGVPAETVIRDIQSSLQRGWRSSDSFAIQARAQMQLGRYQAAADSLTLALQLDTDDFDKRGLYYQRSRVDRMLKRYAEADRDQAESVRLTNLRLRAIMARYRNPGSG